MKSKKLSSLVLVATTGLLIPLIGLFADQAQAHCKPWHPHHCKPRDLIPDAVNPLSTYKFDITNSTGTTLNYSIDSQRQPPHVSGMAMTYTWRAVTSPTIRFDSDLTSGDSQRKYDLRNGGNYEFTRSGDQIDLFSK